MATDSKDFKVKNGLIVAEGGTFGGTVTVAAPTSNTHAATKLYVDDLLASGGSGSITVSDTAPSNPSEGDLWYNSTDGSTYVYYDSFWVESTSAYAGPTGMVAASAPLSFDEATSTLTIDLSSYYTSAETDAAIAVAVSSLVDSAPDALNTLNELSAALNDDENFATTVTNSLATKQDVVANVSDTEIGYLDGVTSGIQTQLDSKANKEASINTQTGDYVLTVSDAGAVVQVDSASPTTVTLPTDSLAAVPTGSFVDIVNLNSGEITLVPGSGSLPWETQPYGATSSIYEILYDPNQNRWVSIASGGSVKYSSDTYTWYQASGVNNYVTAADFSGDKFIAVGNFAGYDWAIQSTDGMSWSGIDITNTGLRDIKYANGLWVVVGTYGGILWSEDNGVTWNAATGTGPTSIIGGGAVGYGDGVWLAANNYSLAISNDGKDWSLVGSNVFGGSDIKSISYYNGLFVAVGEYGKISTSTDGTNWTARTSGTNSYFYKVENINGTWYAVGTSGATLTSADGISWASFDAGFGSTNALSIGSGNDLILIGGSSGLLQRSGTVTADVFSKNSNLKLSSPYSAARLYKKATNQWVVTNQTDLNDSVEISSIMGVY